MQTRTISKRKTTVMTTLTALFAALIAAGAFISIPLPFSPVPIAIQNLFAVLAGLVLGPVFGALSVGLYLLAGALGAPVFAGATGGFVHFAAPSGGYLFGYLLAAGAAGLIAGFPKNGDRSGGLALWRAIAAVVAGFAVVYVPGLLQLKAVLAATWPEALAWGLSPFIIGDVIKAVVVVFAAPRLRQAVADVCGN
jgi:biotin transport system substrate-specific component